MTAPGNPAVLLTMLTVLTACTGYAAGRLHQWYRTGADRDEAYRDGYDTATRSTFSLAARIVGPRRERAAGRASAAGRPSSPRAAAPGPASGGPSLSPFFAPTLVPPSSGAAPRTPAPPPRMGPDHVLPLPSTSGKGGPPGRHLVPDALVQAATYRLAQDRVARARVHGAVPPADPGAETNSRPVPKPRSS